MEEKLALLNEEKALIDTHLADQRQKLEEVGSQVILFVRFATSLAVSNVSLVTCRRQTRMRPH